MRMRFPLPSRCALGGRLPLFGRTDGGLALTRTAGARVNNVLFELFWPHLACDRLYRCCGWSPPVWWSTFQGCCQLCLRLEPGGQVDEALRRPLCFTLETEGANTLMPPSLAWSMFVWF